VVGVVGGGFRFFFSSGRRHTRSKRDWSSDVCSSDLALGLLDEERDALRPPDAPRGGQAFSIGVLSASAVDHLPWCSLWFTGKWCSCGTDIAGFPIYEGA